MSRDPVLVLGDDSRSCLAIVRSLGRSGKRVILGHETVSSLVKHSRYVSASVAMPDVSNDPRQWLSRLYALLDEFRPRMVIPASDRSMVPIVRHMSEEEISNYRIAVPNPEAFKTAYRKDLTVSLAMQLGIPVPRTILANSPGDLPAATDLPFPLVVKPVSSKVWLGEEHYTLSVQVARTDQELALALEATTRICPVLIQEYVDGIGVGQEFLCANGVILDQFQHRRVHEPNHGGGSSYRISVPLHERMLACSRRLLSHLAWDGVAMVEYRWNPGSDAFHLMEVNGRFWGSLPLALCAGVDFPSDLFDYLVGGRKRTPRPYKVGVYCRNLAADLTWASERMRSRGAALHKDTTGRGALLKELLNILRGREHWDTLTLDDPLPGIVELGRLGARVTAAVKGRLERYTARTRWEHPALRGFYRRRLHRLLKLSSRIAFACRGNICRSPYAEERFRQLTRTAGLDFTCESFGTHPHSGRPSPANALEAAKAFDVDLKNHRSRNFKQTIEANQHLTIVCMDATHASQLAAEAPQAGKQVVLLGAFANGTGNLGIKDPLGGKLPDFVSCYEKINACLEGLIEELRTHK